MNKGLKKRISYFIPVSAIEEDDNLPRKLFREDKIKDMSVSIKEKGLKQPILVRPKKGHSDKYKIIICHVSAPV